MRSHTLFGATVFECKDITRNLIRGGRIGLSNSTGSDDMNIRIMQPRPCPVQFVMEELSIRVQSQTLTRQLVRHHRLLEHSNPIYSRVFS
jgi:hypothetical protein